MARRSSGRFPYHLRQMAGIIHSGHRLDPGELARHLRSGEEIPLAVVNYIADALDPPSGRSASAEAPKRKRGRPRGARGRLTINEFRKRLLAVRLYSHARDIINEEGEHEFVAFCERVGVEVPATVRGNASASDRAFAAVADMFGIPEKTLRDWHAESTRPLRRQK